MMKYSEKVSKPSASYSSKLKQMQKSLLEPRSIEHNKTEYEATADIGAPLLSYNLVNIPAYPPVQRKEPEEDELQMKPSKSCPECEEEEVQAKSIGDSVTQKIQRQADSDLEEETLQGKFLSVQRKEPHFSYNLLNVPIFPPIQRQEPEEEEELLQGKMAETVQRQPEPNEEELMQDKFASGLTGTLQAKEAASTNKTGMPDHLKSGIEMISGMDLSNIRVRYNSPKPAQLNALAYTQGHEIYVAPGQEQYLPHEAWHVVQQAQGLVKPTMQLRDKVPVNNDKRLEHEADIMGEKAAQLNALAYAQESDIHVGQGQEKHLTRGAWHMVQQGREARSMGMKGVKQAKIEDSNRAKISPSDSRHGKYRVRNHYAIVIQRHMSDNDFRKKVGTIKIGTIIGTISTLLQQSMQLSNGGDILAWRTWMQQVDTECDRYLSGDKNPKKIMETVAKLKSEIGNEWEYINKVVNARSQTPVERLRALILLQDMDYQRLPPNHGLNNAFNKEYNEAAAALDPSQKRQIIEDDLIRLKRISDARDTPLVVGKVIQEILAMVPETHLTHGMPMGAPTTPNEQLQGITERYSVKVPAYQVEGTPGRLGELAHELTHVSVSSHFGNQPELAIVATATEHEMSELCDERRAIVNNLRSSLAEPENRAIPDPLKSFIESKLTYVMEPKLRDYVQRFEKFGFINSVRATELGRIADSIPNNSLLVEFDSVINQILINLQQSRIDQGIPFFSQLLGVAHSAYLRRH